MESQKLKCYVLGPKSQKFPTAENTRYTVLSEAETIEMKPVEDLGYWGLTDNIPNVTERPQKVHTWPEV